MSYSILSRVVGVHLRRAKRRGLSGWPLAFAELQLARAAFHWAQSRDKANPSNDPERRRAMYARAIREIDVVGDLVDVFNRCQDGRDLPHGIKCGDKHGNG